MNEVLNVRKNRRSVITQIEQEDYESYYGVASCYDSVRKKELLQQENWMW